MRTTAGVAMAVAAAVAVAAVVAVAMAGCVSGTKVVHGAHPDRVATTYTDAGVVCAPALARGTFASASAGSSNRNKLITVEWDKINDAYCDCADGADEPGTSACAGVVVTPAGDGAGAHVPLFHCANVGSSPKDLDLSFVSDGICDCCDGSDEAGGSLVACSNTCAEEGREMMRKIRERNRVVIAGATAKLAYIADGAAAHSEARVAAAAAQVEVDELKAKYEAAKDAVAAAEKLETIAKARKARLERDAEIAAAAAADADTDADAEAADAEPDTDAADAEPDTDAAADAEPLEPLDTFETLEGGTEGLVQVPIGTEDEVITAAGEARDARDAIQRDMTLAESTARDAQSKANVDAGPEDEYFTLASKCISLKTREYEYEVCPFKNAHQKSLTGGSSTNLGSWTKWETPGAYTTMVFENGAKCWNGPHRSIKVTLVCGSEDVLYGVEEPEKCAYVAILATPAACDATHAAVQDISVRLEGIEYEFGSV